MEHIPEATRYNDAMKRDRNSHKGENGKTAVIGGSKAMHGAPLFAALAAEAAGVDLVFVCLPRCHGDIAKNQSLNVQVHPFASDELEKRDQRNILELLATMDSAVIGPGLDRDPATLAIIRGIVSEASCPLVVDASALQPWTLDAVAGRGCVLTPHAGELERMKIRGTDIGRAAKEKKVTILAKGPIDRVADSHGMIKTIRGGNAGLTVGGTGDALAGLVAGLLAQRLPAAEACRIASTVIKKAGDALFKEFGYAYGTRRVIERIPAMLKRYG